MQELYNSGILFASSFVVVLLLGFQSQIVRLGHKGTAFMTSLAIGVMQVFSFKLVPNAGAFELIAFIMGGACGISASIDVHMYYVKRLGIKDNRGVSG